ncbi:TetR/AcrR family transcriptional regulator [Luteococcus peritonei]|uniref:TetR/AcrR family transcriptional regulator n=1 Tax=Luteococcus peritonei TaxID=88874 RepID=A0ABW4RXG5_9ACTN
MPKIVDHEQRRAELAQAAVELVRSQGVAALSVRNLAQASGWSAGAVRHYLPTHRDIVALVSEHVRAGFERRLAAVEAPGDPAAQLLSLLRAVLPLDDQSRELSQVWLAFLGAEVHQEQGAGAMVYDELAGLFTDFFTACQREGQLVGESPRQAAATLQAQLDGLTVHLLLGRVDHDQALAALDAVVGCLVRRPASAAQG